MKSKIIKSKVKKTKILHLHSDDIPNIEKILLESEITSVQLSDFGGSKHTNANWLKNAGYLLKELVILPRFDCKFDFRGLRYCKNLRHLIVQNYKKSVVDVSLNTELRSLSITDGDYLLGLEKLNKLQQLVIDKPSKLFFEGEFLNSESSSLNYLCISKPKVQFEMRILSNKGLKSILFYQCKNLNIDGIEELNLETLEFDKCKNVKGIDSLRKCDSIVTLKVIDSFHLESLDFLRPMSALRCLVVLGKSHLIDGDLSSAISKLEHFGFDNKRHYSMKHEDFKKLKQVDSPLVK